MASTTLLHPIPPTISPRISGVRVQTCPFICSLRRTSVGVIRLRGSEAARQQWRSTRRRGISVRCGAAKFIGQSEFGSEVLESDLPVLVDFVADWCGPCKLIAPSIDWASQEYEGRIKVVKIDHDANPELIAKYKVYGLPCLIVFKNGKDIPESRREGAITKAKLKAYLDSLLD